MARNGLDGHETSGRQLEIGVSFWGETRDISLWDFTARGKPSFSFFAFPHLFILNDSFFLYIPLYPKFRVESYRFRSKKGAEIALE